jgi:GT2 family glycosyltransferase
LCIDSIRQFTELGTYEIIVVDNASIDGTIEWLKQQDDIKTILNNENLGFPKGCNQGIEIASGENILLLNNDTLVTQNWLDNLLACLYSSADIGAVGPVTNSAAYYSTIPVQYRSLEEMHEFSSYYNISDCNKWDARLKLIGFCMLIKKEVIDKIGLMDERFTPGNFEDDDFSIRMRQTGYHLVLCRDTFIHHFGSISWKENRNAYSGLLSENEKKFKEKWGTDSKDYIIHFDLLQKIHKDENAELNILHIGCKAGGTLLELRNRYKKAKLYGIEKSSDLSKESIAFVELGYLFNEADNLKNYFDIILFTDDNVQLTNDYIRKLKDLLKDDGLLISKLPNLSHFSLINSVLSGDNPYSDRFQHYYNLNEITKIFEDTMSNVSMVESPIPQESKQKITEGLSIIFKQINNNLIYTHHFIVELDLSQQRIVSCLEEILDGRNLYNNLDEINKIEIETILEIAMQANFNIVDLLHKIALENFKYSKHENVIPYLQTAYELDKNNTDTLYNLSYILKCYGQLDLAREFSKKIKDSDPEIDKLKKELIVHGN